MEFVDVLIIGAGLSGVGAACHLVNERPGTTFALLEARASIGGTWDLFRYPGVRSDSDMFTLGYAFAPWRDPLAIANGPSILAYIAETARSYGIDDAIRFQKRAIRAAWSSDEALWRVTVLDVATGRHEEWSSRFLWGNTGYYRYDAGHRPHFPEEETFTGTIVHPQLWPEALDYTDAQVVVIGSGATAVTLVPSLAERAAHVTMLQRSPTYVVSRPSRDVLADRARARLPAKAAYSLVRAKNVALGTVSFQLSRLAPGLVKRGIRKGVEDALPAGFDVERHFSPHYDPWDQRLCLVPDGDLFAVLADGRASVVTDTIERFVPDGVQLSSGAVLPADVIVTATGLEIQLFGGMELEVDGVVVDPGRCVAYKGMMLCGVPNFAFTFGYTNASWTLKADLTASYLCRLLDVLDERGLITCTPEGPTDSEATEPFLDFSSGYVRRALEHLPRQGRSQPWRLHQNYLLDMAQLRWGRIDHCMTFSAPAHRAS